MWINFSWYYVSNDFLLFLYIQFPIEIYFLSIFSFYSHKCQKDHIVVRALLRWCTLNTWLWPNVFAYRMRVDFSGFSGLFNVTVGRFLFNRLTGVCSIRFWFRYLNAPIDFSVDQSKWLSAQLLFVSEQVRRNFTVENDIMNKK